MQKRHIALKIAEPAAILLSIILLVLTAAFGVEQTALFSIVIVVAAMVPFFLRFEKQNPRPRDIVPIVVLTVIAALGRALFTFAPNIQPSTAVIIVVGIAFGSQAGFLTGALTALTSNLIMGQGPWTPWQMLAWGLVGWIAGLLQRTTVFKKSIPVTLYGFIASFVFGWVMNIHSVFWFGEDTTWQVYISSCVLSFYFDLMHAISTTVFLTLILVPWRKKLGRIKQKYGIQNGE